MQISGKLFSKLGNLVIFFAKIVTSPISKIATQIIRITISAGLVLGICNCSGINFSQWRFPYMMEIQQGNQITTAQVNQLHNGMTKEQVTFIVWHPLTQFMFDQNRWDFFYQDYKSFDLEQSYTLTLLFDKEGKVISITKTGQFFSK